MTTNVAASVSDDMGVDDWLDQKDGSGGGDGPKYLKLFGDDEKEHRVWIAPKAVSKIKNIWRVVWPVLDREGKKVRLLRWNVMEPTDRLRKTFLYKMNFKEDDGSFQHQPTVDPFAFLLQWVNQQIEGGTLGFTDPIFAWEPEEGDETAIHAGGFVNGFSGSKIPDDRKALVAKAKIRGTEGYKESCVPKEETVLILVDDENPEDGPQICTIGRGFSKSFQEAIENRKKRFSKKEITEGKHELDKFPACWSITKDDSGPFPKYIVAESAGDITEELQAAFDADLPDTSKMYAPSNVAMLRDSMQTHWVHEEIEPDWDEIFKRAEKAVEGTPAAEATTSFNYGKNVKKEEETEENEESKTQPEEKKEEAVDAPPCDACGKPIPLEVFDSDPVKCPHCGAEYELKDGEYCLKPKVEEKVEKPKIRASRRPK